MTKEEIDKIKEFRDINGNIAKMRSYYVSYEQHNKVLQKERELLKNSQKRNKELKRQIQKLKGAKE